LKKKLKFFNISLNLNNLVFLFSQINSNKSFLRSTHYLFLKKFIKAKKDVADLGSGKKKDYHKFISNKNIVIDKYDFHKISNDVNKIDLEKKFKLKKKYNSVLLFNVFEHIYNRKKLIISINKSLKKNGKLEIFVPFMYKFHGDPNDFVRPTHAYLERILKESGFKVNSTLIGTGQMIVILEIIFRHLKFSYVKFLFAIIFLFLNKFFDLFSKDFKSFYCGIHCSCIKIK
tara:strand:- start:10134 stop:10823 length:690 start_codon:yes stop_codon:yes gene_type:complete